MNTTRRDFLKMASILATVSTDVLSQTSVKSNIKLGYSAITWGGKDTDAIRDIAELGFGGIQLRSNTVPVYRDKMENLIAQLKARGLELCMFSSGNVEIDPAKEESTINWHTANAEFVKKLGGSSIQLTNNARPKDRPPSTDELKRLAQVMNKIGQQTADMGIQAVYHNHMHQLGETPEEVSVILNELDSRYVKLLLDIAHYHQGGGDPVKAVGQYKDILHALHIKDVQCPKVESPTDPRSYRFVELGQGNVNVKGVFEALRKIGFKGWCVVELDGVPSPERTPYQCAEISKRFLVENKIWS
jgi:inosose dehydratase